MFWLLSFGQGDACITTHPFWFAAGEKDGAFKLQITWLHKVMTEIKKSYVGGAENLKNSKN